MKERNTKQDLFHSGFKSLEQGCSHQQIIWEKKLGKITNDAKLSLFFPQANTVTCLFRFYKLSEGFCAYLHCVTKWISQLLVLGHGCLTSHFLFT